MCQVAHCALCVMCTTHVHNPGPWPSVWQGHWVPQAVGPIEFGYRGGVGQPQSQAWATNGAPNCPQLLHACSGGPVGGLEFPIWGLELKTKLPYKFVGKVMDKTNKLIKDSNLKIIPDMRHLIEPPVFIQFKDDLLNHLTS